MEGIFITAMLPRKGRLVDLCSGDEVIVTLDSALVAERALAPQREYSAGTLRELLTESQLRRAKAKALYLLGFRDYSARALSERLRRGFDARAVNSVMDYLVETGAVSDARYAEVLADHLTRNKHYGRRRILQELCAKGIDRDQAEDAIEKLGLDEPAAILELLDTKFSRDLGDEKGVRRTIATLQRYGYRSDDIFQVLREFEARKPALENSE